jgi:hypothetical protein
LKESGLLGSHLSLGALCKPCNTKRRGLALATLDQVEVAHLKDLEL